MSFDSEYRPALQPPDWVFGPVWSFLYISLGFSIYLTWMSRDELENSNLVFGVFAIQLILNLMWSSFFNSEQYLVSTLIIGGMIVFTAIYAYLIYDSVQLASVLVFPYIAWITFAGYLNILYFIEA